MYFLDLATQGVRAFSSNARVALTPGYVVLHPPGSEAVPFSALLLSLLYPDGRGTDGGLAAPGAKVGKAALTLLGNDAVTYRIVRELGGSGVLQRLNKTSHRFEVVTQDVTEAGQFLRSSVGAPTRATFEQLFSLRPAQLPSRNPKPAKAAPQKKITALAFPSVASPSADAGAAERKLRDLSKELELSQEVEQLQAKQDEIASEMFALESVLKGSDSVAGPLQEAESAYQAAPSPESMGLPADILQRIEAYPEAVRKRDAALAKLPPEPEGEVATAEVAPAVVAAPLHRDARFIAAVVLGTASLVAGALLQGWGRYVALLDIPFFGVAALFALQWIDEVRSSEHVGRQGGRAAARRKKILDEFEAEAAPVRAALSALGVQSEEEARNVLGQRAVLRARVEELRKQAAAAKSGREIVAATKKHAELKARSDALAAKLQERAGGYVRESREVQREMQRVRESLDQARSSPAPAADPVPAAPAGVSFEDPSPALLAAAADHAHSDPAAVAGQVRDRCAQYLTALCDRRYTAVELDARAGATLVAGDKRVRAAELVGRDLDLFAIALRLAIVENVSTGLRVPVVIEDLDAVVEASRHAPLARMLKHLGTLTQVVQVSGSQGFGSGADVRANV